MNGVNKVVHNLATEQTRLGHDVEVWGLGKRENIAPTLKREYTLQLFPITRLRLTLSGQMQRAIDSLPRDVWVQLHSVFVPEFRPIAKKLAYKGVALGLTPHGGYSPHVMRRGWLKKHAYMWMFEVDVLRRASLIHAIGASEVDDVRALVPRANVVLARNGQTVIEMDHAFALEVRDERPVYTYCGRLAMQHKGLDLLLGGFSKYKGAGGRGTLWVIGDGEDRAKLERLSLRLGIEDKVKFHGPRFGDEKLKRLAASDVFVHPSRWDVVPTSCLEAAGMKLPLVVSHETNMGTVVREWAAGLVLPQNEVGEISKALSECASMFADGSLKELGLQAGEMIAQRFKWSEIASELVDHYARHMND